MRRMITSFVSADRYDPKEVFTYLHHVLEPSRKCFEKTYRIPDKDFPPSDIKIGYPQNGAAKLFFDCSKTSAFLNAHSRAPDMYTNLEICI